MAQSMLDIKRRIRSVSNTRQITKAMELVSSAKLRKSRQKLEKTRPYYNTVIKSIQEVLSMAKGVRHPLLARREIKTSAYIVITSDRGLCGGYNSNVMKMVQTDIKDKENALIITIGQKARDYFSKRGYNVKESFVGISEDPEYAHADKIGSLVTQLYKDGEVDEVKLAYTHFKSTIVYSPEFIRLLPASIENKEMEQDETIMEYEPSPEVVLGYLIPKYINSAIYGMLIESSASEQAARRVAMENATDNADEMIESLKLSYNRARQAAITQEISEIVSGANALQ